MFANYNKEYDVGFYTTLYHELRHLGISNPFLSKDYPAYENETDTENWGRRTFEYIHEGGPKI